MKREMKVPKGYDPKTQKQVGLFAAQLDDQLKRLKNNVKGLTVAQLEWQRRKGMNTIGMLLAHLALVDYWWIELAPAGVSWTAEGKDAIQLKFEKKLGFKDDGLPVPPTGKHYKELSGYTVEQYLSVLAKARRSVHRELKTWKDRDLDKLYSLGKRQFSKSWTLYHVLEHFAAHFGQILMIKHMMRDVGVLKADKK